MELKEVVKVKDLLDNYLRLVEIERRLSAGGQIKVVSANKENVINIDGLDEISEIDVYIPAPLRLSFLTSVRELIMIESNKIKEL